MRNRLILLTLLVFTLIFGTISYLLYDFNSDLQIQLKKSEKIISDTKARDSAYAIRTKEYSEVITKYVSDCEFTIDGKTISTTDLIKIVNDGFKENQILKDSLFYFKQLYESQRHASDEYRLSKNHLTDSVFIYKNIVELISQKYDVEFSFKRSEKGYSFSRSHFGKSDSALILLPYFRDRLKQDSIKNTWLITTEKKN